MKKHAIIRGERCREAERLSPAMWRTLREANGEPVRALSGRSEYGGACGTRLALRSRGFLLPSGELTPAGRRLLEVEWCEPFKPGKTFRSKRSEPTERKPTQ